MQKTHRIVELLLHLDRLAVIQLAERQHLLQPCHRLASIEPLNVQPENALAHRVVLGDVGERAHLRQPRAARVEQPTQRQLVHHHTPAQQRAHVRCAR